MPAFDLRILDALSDVPAASWDALLEHEPARATPFLRHAFLEALEASGCASVRTGWLPRHLTLWRGGRLVAAAPCYSKADSDGDFSRDWEWAAAAQQGGVTYYPKLLLTVPFTPATGRRLLVSAGEDRAPAVRALVAGARALAAEEGLRSVQVLFPGADEARELEVEGFAVRVDFQYHWVNAGYREPADFLARFSSKRRNVIRRERAAPGRQGIAIRSVRGAELAADGAGWAKAMFELHRASVDEMPWGMRWVNRGFYERVLAVMPDALEIVEARRGGALVAAAFNVASPTRLYGRYWGCREEHPFLHFNVCLYHSVDECIRRGLEAFEGGAGGEHKLARGFEPALTCSAHFFLDARLDGPLRRHLAFEARERRAALARWRQSAPVLKAAAPRAEPGPSAAAVKPGFRAG
ncbi:MAG: GNAT family N-acetyltransferase [Anaeromyxobacter sp. RBG_16_69_14]|nr:MAG: GNAT family N-acetyltransferase [Anaeromyxobacter sp. RBG_16_69_14]